MMTQLLSEAFFRSAIESSADCICVLGEDGRLLFTNRGGLDAFEIDDFATLAGCACKSLWPEPAATQIDIGIEAALRGVTHRFEGVRPTTSGEEKWWEVSVAPVHDNAGALAGIIATSHDVTTAHQLRIEAEARTPEHDRSAAALRSASRIARVGGWEINFVTGQTLIAAEVCELLGLPPTPAMPSVEANALWCDEDRVRFEEGLARVEANGEGLVFEGRSAGRSWRLLGEPVLDGGRCIAVRGAAQDITEWRDTVEREQAALKTAQAMSSFLATMSHEIRTPLNGILGMAQAMGLGELSNVQRGRLEIIEASGEALLSLLNDLLDLSRIEAGRLKLHVSEVDTEELVAGARKVFAPLMRGKDVRLDLRVAPNARGRWVGDPDRVRQVLHHLIANAVKFTEHGSIDVVVAHTGYHLILHVHDTGIGIAAAQLPHVFDRFVQGDASTTRRFGGSGLGLAICSDLVGLMKGDIHVESVEGQGSIFTVGLPLARVKASAALTLVPSASSTTSRAKVGLRVLVAEDNSTNQLVLKTLLGAVGIEPLIVSNGREALDAWRSDEWDIVLMDIQMPVMDGITAARLMRESERSDGRPHTPIIAVTANAMTHHEAQYKAAGMDSMVSKPVDLRTLVQAMELALEFPRAA
jgi:PAS domain S-box-containing protein